MDKIERLIDKAKLLPGAYIEHNVDTKLKTLRGVKLVRNETITKNLAVIIHKLQ